MVKGVSSRRTGAKVETKGNTQPPKRVSIVFEENGTHGGKGFNVYLTGLSPEAVAIINTMDSEAIVNKLSPAEFWASRMFNVCGTVLFEHNVVTDVQRSS